MAQYITLNKNQYDNLVSIISGGTTVDFTELIDVFKSEKTVERIEPLNTTGNIIYSEGDTTAIVNDNNVTLSWSSGTALGFTLSFATPISSDVEKITADVTVRTAYNSSSDIYYNCFGVRADYTPYQYMGYTWQGWLNKVGINQQNTTIALELDLSSITNDSYLYICGGGWNIDYNNITLHYASGATESVNIADILSSINDTLIDISSKL